jgi:hypothetical protein
MSFTGVDDLLGAWRLESAVEVFDDGERRDEFGPNPDGYLSYNTAGIVSATLGDSARPPVSAGDPQSGSDEDYEKMARHLVAYARAVQCRCRQRDRHPSCRRLAVPELARPRPSPTCHDRGRTVEHHRIRANLGGRPDLPQ